MTHCLRGLDVCIGAMDEAAHDRRVSDRAIRMGKLKQIPVSVAQSLLKGGQQAIDNARDLATDSDLPGAPGSRLPGKSARDKVYGKLKWHEDALDKLSATPDATYAPGSDLKNWVLEAFTEWDAASEGADEMNKAWSSMWTEIGHRIAALPQAIAQAAGATLKETAWYAKATFWAALGAGVVAIGIISWGVSSGVKHRISGR